MKFKFGDKILVKGYIRRGFKFDNDDPLEPSNGTHIWERLEYPKPMPAIYLKRITLSEGRMETSTHYTYDGPEYDRYFNPTKTIPGAWICRKGFKPEKVFLEDIEEIK